MYSRHYYVALVIVSMCNSSQMLSFSFVLFYIIFALNFNELPEIIFAANIGSLINCARQRGQWDFFCRTKQLVLISCLEDSTNEVELP